MNRTRAIKGGVTRTHSDTRNEVVMNKNENNKFSWCPVCMVHTYHQKEKGKWICTEKNHEDFLRYRTDPWIKEYRKSKSIFQMPAAREA